VIDRSSPKGAAVLERLATDPIGWLTTVTPSGQPQSMPVWFLWERGEILFFSFRTAARNRNLRANPQVSFHLGDRSGGEVVSIEGEARFDSDATPAGRYPPYVAKYGDRIQQGGWTADSFDADYPHAVRIRPTRVTIE
jgi:PPOX class probable F420-dependent enzyme